jgi:type IV pilus assembly protein PilW
MSIFSVCRRHRGQRGLSLVELMAALTIGMFVVLVIASVFVSSKRSSRYQEATARLQENARYAMELLSRTVRNSGYRGCGMVSKLSNVVTGGESNWWLNLSSPLIGYEGGVSAFPTYIAGPASGTDALVTVGVDPSIEASVVSHNPVLAQFETTAHSFQPGAIMVVTDCGHTTVFQMSGPTNGSNSATTVVHDSAAGSPSPGNCYKGLGASCSATQKNYTFQPGSTLMKLSGHTYYVAASQSGVGRSLWNISLNGSGGTTAPVELIEGVDDLQLEYGEDTDGDGAPNRYVVASDVSAWPQVVAVRVSLLMRTLEDNLSSTAQTYQYNGHTVTATDRRVRRSYTSVVTLRNRSQ